MKNKLAFLLTFSFIGVLIFPGASGISLYKTGTDVVLSGRIGTGVYLSFMNNSEIEYLNESFQLVLEDKITIENEEGERFPEISNIEIRNPYLGNISEYVGKEVEITGRLGIFNSENYDYNRQYSTDAYIDIISIKPADQ